MFAIGIVLFTVCLMTAFWCGLANVDAPGWVEFLGGLGLLSGVVLMVISSLLHIVPRLWAALP